MRTSLLLIVVLGLFCSCAFLQGGQEKTSENNDFTGEGRKSSAIPGITDKVIESRDNSELLKESLKLDVRKEVLSNGLTILIVENNYLPIFSYYTFFKIGSRYEDPGMTGATHFLEHMMFKGAKKYKAGDFDRIIQENGGDNNAFTTPDATVYYESLPSLALEQVIDLEADRMQNLLLEEESFTREKSVVLEERKMRYEDRPAGKLALEVMTSMNKGTPYEEPPIGRIEDIQNYKREDVLLHFKNYYAPNNAIIVVVGDVDASKTIKLIKKYYEKIERSTKVNEIREMKDNESLFVSEVELGKEYRFKGQSKNPLFAFAYPGFKSGSFDSNVADLLSFILSSGQSSYFFQKYRNGKKPMVSQLQMDVDAREKRGEITIEGELLAGVSMNEFKKTFFADGRKFCEEAITERNLAKAKNQYFIQYFEALRTNAGLAFYLGSFEMLTGNYKTYQDEIESYASITLPQIKDMCERIFLNTKPNLYIVWDQHK